MRSEMYIRVVSNCNYVIGTSIFGRPEMVYEPRDQFVIIELPKPPLCLGNLQCRNYTRCRWWRLCAWLKKTRDYRNNDVRVYRYSP